MLIRILCFSAIVAGCWGNTLRRNGYYCNQDPCEHGLCIEQENGYLCACYNGYIGDNCNVKVSSCQLPCQNGGVCDNSTCLCPNSHYGQYCEIEKPDPCANQPCGRNGYCLTNQLYDDYYCQCKSGYGGKFCEIPICVGRECEMNVSRCDTVMCGNGRCVDDYELGTTRCVCPIGYIGERCELKNLEFHLENDSPSSRGTVIVVMIGNVSHVFEQSKFILDRLNEETKAQIELGRTQRGKAMLYQWDSINGKGDLIDQDVLDQKDNYSNERFGAVFDGILMVLEVNTLECVKLKQINPNEDCPATVLDVASLLVTPRTQEVLKPLGLQIHSAEQLRQLPESSTQFFLGLCVIGTILVGILMVLTVLNNGNKAENYKFSQAGDPSKGSLLGAAVDDRRLIRQNVGPTWIPPREEPDPDSNEFELVLRDEVSPLFAALRKVASAKSHQYKRRTGATAVLNIGALERAARFVENIVTKRWRRDLARFSEHARKTRPDKDDALMIFNRYDTRFMRVEKLFYLTNWVEIDGEVVDEEEEQPVENSRFKTLGEMQAEEQLEPQSWEEFKKPRKELRSKLMYECDLIKLSDNRYHQVSTGATIVIQDNPYPYPTGNEAVFYPGPAKSIHSGITINRRPEAVAGEEVVNAEESNGNNDEEVDINHVAHEEVVDEEATDEEEVVNVEE
ncbi:unnamed protein product [Bursaphelenchus okinawaensis]|uniref:EGF-like domain-containing protein n=1 Tax=Bursaphelenchus okinawaensis TaxID=465554 RepID=A0A811K671_9BILA|nr:unnamed protein product [Bursaphelenchus okinawaensis]CAG9092244.1 unnamed protein product [Bursaphelenchus okinawaensis]